MITGPTGIQANRSSTGPRTSLSSPRLSPSSYFLGARIYTRSFVFFCLTAKIRHLWLSVTWLNLFFYIFLLLPFLSTFFLLLPVLFINSGTVEGLSCLLSQSPRAVVVLSRLNLRLTGLRGADIGLVCKNMALVSSFLEIFQRPTVLDVFFELMEFMSPIWIALVVGVFVGWAWKPKWANLNIEIVDSTSNKGESKPDDSLSPSRSESVFPQFCASMPNLSSLKLQLPSCVSWLPDSGLEKENSSLPSVSSPNLSSSKLENGESSIVNWDDFKHFHNLVEEKDGGPCWIQMMDRSAPSMSYQAWRRDPETGPPQYRSRTVYEDATPEILRDFFGDDEFRSKWDDMLIYSETLDECPSTGTMCVQWVRKFPFFCSDREYIIGRRIWHSGSAYYCVTKGVPSSSVPRRNKPRRVDLYYSSWCIRAAESKRDGRTTACEVLLFHHEDMGIPWEIAKLGVRQGMWGAVKKIEPGLRAYQKHRAYGAPLSRSALMAQVNTKVCVDSLDLESLDNGSNNSSVVEPHCSKEDKHWRGGIPKMLVIGGAIVLTCSFDRGLLTKAVLFGVARRFANIGRRL